MADLPDPEPGTDPSAAEAVDVLVVPPGGPWEADVVLSDGGTMHIRPIVPDDGERLLAFHERQSAESIYFRYFSPRPRLSTTDVARLTTVDGIDRMAFVGVINDELVGVARYDRYPARSVAEVAFFTDDRHAGRGMATVLLEYLAAWARGAGITGFNAQVLPTNRRMLGVFKQVGFEVTSRFEDGVIEVEFPIEPTEEAHAAMLERARVAEARSVARILSPRSVAVIGASRRADTLGHAVVRRLLSGDFDGPVYPVNPEAGVVASVRAHASILDIPDEIDLAVVVVPADQITEVVEQCGRKRVQGLVVVSAGFAESGPEGVERERALLEQARRLGLRLIGPNTMGVVNTGARLVATFADVAPRPGPVAVSSQSGTLGAAILRRLDDLGLGVSSFVATGNKADVSGNDLLQYWETDEATRVVLLYLESFGNPRNFARIARRVGTTKPIVAVKAGRTLSARRVDDPAGWAGPTRGGGDAARATEQVAEALLAQTGVVRVDTLEQMFDVTRILVRQPLPAGRRVAILSNFWGPAVLATDACTAAGLELAEVDVAALERDVRPHVPVEARLGNPLELTADAEPAQLAVAARGLLADPSVDALLVLHAPSLTPRVGAMADALDEVERAATKPIVASFLGSVVAGDGVAGEVPLFAFPEAAAGALGRVARYAEWRSRQTGVVPAVEGFDEEAARDAVHALVDRLWGDDAASAQASEGDAAVEAERATRPVPLADALDLLAMVGVEPVAQTVVSEVEEAIAAAERIGWPVALKATGVDRPSRTEEGGVAVDVFGETELRLSFDRMAAHHGAAMEPALVQEMAPNGVDCRLAVLQHPVLGSVIELGPALGRGARRRILPLTDADALDLVQRGPMADDLGAVASDGRAALVDLLLRLSALADAAPELAEVRLAPLIVSDGRAAITDVRMRVAPWPTAPVVRSLT